MADRNAAGSRSMASSGVAMQITDSVPGVPVSSTKGGLGDIQSGMRIVVLAETEDEGFDWFGSSRITLPCGLEWKQYRWALRETRVERKSWVPEGKVVLSGTGFSICSEICSVRGASCRGGVGAASAFQPMRSMEPSAAMPTKLRRARS